MADAWIPLESNPDVLNAYAQKLGLLAGWHFSDVFSLEHDDLKALKEPRAFLLLYPCSDKTASVQLCAADCSDKECGTSCCTKPPFFMLQHNKNACGAVALFHSLANNLELCSPDSAIQKFVDEAASLSATERGKLFGERSDFRTINDNVAQEGQTAAPDSNAEIDLHFVAVIRSGPCVYVLDGRRDAPICACSAESAEAISDEKFTLQVANVAKKLMDAAESVHFSVMALTAAE